MSLNASDRLALSDLVHVYASAVDDRRFDNVVELFTETADRGCPTTRRVRSSRCAITTGATASAPRWPRWVPSTGPNTRSSARCMPQATTPTMHWAASRASHIIGPSQMGRQATWCWHLRYDDEYLRTRAGWRIHGRALTINAIETRPVRRLREHPAGGRAAGAGPSTAWTSPQRRETNRRGRLPDTP